MRMLILALPALLACGDKDGDSGDDGRWTNRGGGDDTGAPDGDSGFDCSEDGVGYYLDVDGDGWGDPNTFARDCDPPAEAVGNNRDCDDDDAAIHPDAEEVCDDVDNDCDGEADEDGTADGSTYYQDADGDGEGTPSKTRQACDRPNGYVVNDWDCDDDNDEVHGDAEEIACDAIDNDCDGVTDVNTVPGDFATIQEAVDGTADEGSICLQPGVYTEQVDVFARKLSFVGAGGSSEVWFDLGGDLPLFDAASGFVSVSWGSTHTDLDFEGIGLTGSPSGNIDGGFLDHEAGNVVFTDVLVSGLSGSVTDNGDVEGLLVEGRNTVLSIYGLVVDDFELVFDDAGEHSSLDARGGLVQCDNCDVVLHDLDVTGFAISSSGSPERCQADGGLMRLDEGSLQGERWSFVGNQAVLDCQKTARGDGMLMLIQDMDAVLDDVTVSGNSVHYDSSSSTYVDGLFRVREGEHTWTNFVLEDNVTTSANDLSSSYNDGVMEVSPDALDWSHVVCWNNTIRAEATGSSSSGYAYGSCGNFGGPMNLDHWDVRGNSVFGNRYAYGGGIYLSPYVDGGGATASVTNAVFAGNTLEAGYRAYGGGLSFSGSYASLTLRNVDIVGNSVTAEDAYGGGLRLYLDEDENATVSNLNLVSNQATGSEDVAGTAVYILVGDDAPIWTYSNIYDHAGTAVDGFDDPTGANGNVSVDPGYTDVGGTDPTTWDLSLATGSAVIDAGDPNVLDDDTSTSDIGAYGGPGGTSW